MAFKLIDSAQGRWRKVNAPHLVALVGAEPDSPPAGASPTHRKNRIKPTQRRRSEMVLKYLQPRVLTICQHPRHCVADQRSVAGT
jgi:hypothetical protein